MEILRMAEQPKRPPIPGLAQSSTLPTHGTKPTDPVALPTGGDPPERIPVDASPRIGQYQILELVGQGGMGEVFRVRDPQMDRMLAVKVLQAQQCGSLGQARFLDEARLTGQLQHPGIPPVHGVGRGEDGRPYFVMKLIEGRNLGELLAERTSPSEGLLRFVAIFAQICQTLAYAHARGVIHRDLKPANVMVGAFGEVQLMDWGLAKVLKGASSGTLDTDAQAPGTARLTEDLTQVGTILGTPAYMAPEQARGEIDLIDERADVFGLGAILCGILTGKSPYQAGGAAHLLTRAAAGALTPALDTLRDCGADLKLVQIAVWCLEPDPARRPRHAGVVADAIEEYQGSVQEHAQQTQMELARSEVRQREERKRRRLRAILAGLVLLGLLSGVITAWWMQVRQTGYLEERARREERLRVGAEAVVEQADNLSRKALWRDAVKLLDQGGELAREEGSDDLRAQINRARAVLALGEELDRIQESGLLTLEGEKPKPRAPQYAKTFAGHGLNVTSESLDSLADLIRSSPIREDLLAALDDWAVCETDESLQTRLWQLSMRLRPEDTWRAAFADPAIWRDRQKLDRQAAELPVDQVSSQVLIGLCVLLPELEGSLLEKGLQHRPTDFWLLIHFADGLRRKHAGEEAIAFYRAALILRPGSVAARTRLGMLQGAAGKEVKEAIAALNRAIELDGKAIAAHLGLGGVLLATDNLEGALAAYRKALEVEPTNALAHIGVGNVLARRKDQIGFVEAFRRASDSDPTNARSYDCLAEAWRRCGKPQAAEKAYRQAMNVNPHDAEIHSRLGSLKLEQGDPDEAAIEFRSAAALNPDSPAYQRDLAELLYRKKDLEGARTAMRRALTLDPGGNRPAWLGPKAKPGSDLERVERLLAARRDYQLSLEQLRFFYIAQDNMDNAALAEEELLYFHRGPKHPYRLEIDVPPPTLRGVLDIPAVNQMYVQALAYKGRGVGNDYLDNQRRAELLLQKILSEYPTSDRIGDVAFQLGEVYESRAFKQYARAAAYYKRGGEWDARLHSEATLRAARVYDRLLGDKEQAVRLYKEVTSSANNPRAAEEARKRLGELDKEQ
jgi:eukaryotic-like serine/threonine-protein kinase